MRKELQELAPRYFGTDGKEDVESAPMSSNQIQDSPVLEATMSIAPTPMQQAAGPAPTPYFFNILEEEISNVKDSVTSGLSTRGSMGEVVGFGGGPTMWDVELIKVYAIEEDTKEQKIALVVSKNEEKGKLRMDSLIEALWPHKEHSAPMEETVSLVGNLQKCQGPPQWFLHPRLLG